MGLLRVPKIGRLQVQSERGHCILTPVRRDLELASLELERPGHANLDDPSLSYLPSLPLENGWGGGGKGGKNVP